MLTVGLTGGIGAGKSVVSRRLAQLGAVVIDADRLAREVVAPGTEGLREVVAAFGTDVLGADGALDRPALGARVFGDERARRRLEGIIHPRVRSRTAQLTAAAAPDAIVVNDVPLLVEAGLAATYHLVLVVAADPATRVARLVGDRGMTEAEAYARIRAQASDEQRRVAADIVLSNDLALDALYARVDQLWRERLVPYEENLRLRRPVSGQVRIVPYDPTWPAQYARLAARIIRTVATASAATGGARGIAAGDAVDGATDVIAGGAKEGATGAVSGDAAGGAIGGAAGDAAGGAMGGATGDLEGSAASGAGGSVAGGARGDRSEPRVDHIGSTAVPGLPARDIIDCQLTAGDLPEADALGDALARAGFPPVAQVRHDSPSRQAADLQGWEERVYGSADPARPVHLHIPHIRTTGLTGAAGSDSSAGSDGSTGSTGLTGAAGSDRSAGSAGSDRSTGLTGLTGAAGSDSSAGLTGSDRSSRSAGLTGAAGSDGSTSSAGSDNSAGSASAAGSAGWWAALLLRDWLRADLAARADYLAVKQHLAANGLSPAAYAEAKEPWFDKAWPRAQEWARLSGWRPTGA